MLISIRTLTNGAPSLGYKFFPGQRYVQGEEQVFGISKAQWDVISSNLIGSRSAGDIVLDLNNLTMLDFDVVGDNVHDDSAGWAAAYSFAAFGFPLFIPVAPTNFKVGGNSIQGPFNSWPGGQQWHLAAKTAGAAKPAEHMNVVDATAGAVAIPLPAVASFVAGTEFWYKKVDASGNAVTITPNGAETIEGAGSVSLSAQWDKVRLIAYPAGSTWLKA